MGGTATAGRQQTAAEVGRIEVKRLLGGITVLCCAVVQLKYCMPIISYYIAYSTSST